MVESVVQTVTQRADVISFGTLAEINHFQHSRCEDFKATMKTFLTGQIKFYQEVSMADFRKHLRSFSIFVFESN